VAVLKLSVDGRVNFILRGAEFLIEDTSGLLFEDLPLCILELLNFVEEVFHNYPIVFLVILVEPQFIDIDEKAQKRDQLSASRNLVEYP
jgi:hypothetical protein